jgi:hypothetical protein
MNDLSAHPPRLDEALDLLETSEGLSAPGVDRSVHRTVLSEAFMEVASPAEVLVTVAASRPEGTVPEGSVVVIQRVDFPAVVAPAVSPVAVTPVVEVTDNHRCQSTLSR